MKKELPKTGAKKSSQAGLTIFFIVLCILFLIPFIMLVSVSFSNERDILRDGYRLWPRNPSLSAYQYIFKNAGAIINAYKVTISFSAITMIFAVICDAMIAYPLASGKLGKGGRILSFLLYFTMLFSGGLIPSYILITRYLHMGDTIWVYILPNLISPWYVFMMRTFFQGLPKELFEAAKLDGASEYRIFATIVVPLSKPVLATVALFTFLAKWNDWNTSMIYINRDNLISLQYFLQRIMENITMLQNASEDISGLMSAKDIPAETVRMAMAVVVAGPALLVFPFFQKYFTKGLTVGSVKG